MLQEPTIAAGIINNARIAAISEILKPDALKANCWNGETASVSLTDIYRDGSPNLHLSRPNLQAPLKIAGMTRHEIQAGRSLVIQTDARKWRLRDGWLPGRYRIILSIGSLRVDPYTTVTVSSDPIEFEIK